MKTFLHWKKSIDVQNVWIGGYSPAILMDSFKSLLHIQQFHAQILKDWHLYHCRDVKFQAKLCFLHAKYQSPFYFKPKGLNMYIAWDCINTNCILIFSMFCLLSILLSTDFTCFCVTGDQGGPIFSDFILFLAVVLLKNWFTTIFILDTNTYPNVSKFTQICMYQICMYRICISFSTNWYVLICKYKLYCINWD